MLEQESIKRFVRAAFVVASIALCLAIYIYVAQTQSKVNREMRWTDQSSYMDAAIKAYETRFAYTGDRNRMPLYPFLQALFYSPDMSLEEFFLHGKRLNIALSLVCIAALSAIFFARFTRLYATYAMLLIALIVFAIKSPFFQTELLFYTLFGLTFILSIDVIKSPGRIKTVALGAMFALCQYTKASAMPALMIFALSYGVLALARLRERGVKPTGGRDILFSAVMPVLVFLLLLSPYLLESKAKYGTYFYNVNTSFYIWYDSWDEAKAGTRLAGDHVGWPDLPDEEIPSMQKYLAEHSAQDILLRLRDGVATIIKGMCVNDEPFDYNYGYCSQVGFGLIVLAGSLALIAGMRRPRLTGSDLQLLVYTVVFFSFYFISYAWYMPIIIRGVRTVLSLLIPFLWITGLVVHHPHMQSLHVGIRGREFRLFHLVYGAISLTLSLEILRMVTYGARSLWAGP